MPASKRENFKLGHYLWLGRAYPHRIPLAQLKCVSEKRRRELEVCLWDR